MTSNALVTREYTLDTAGQNAIDQVQRLYAMMVSLKGSILQDGVDYGVIPGTGDKPTLYLPGMEKVMRMLNTVPDYKCTSRIEDFDKGLFHYEFECTLIDIDSDKPVPGGRGLGSCNSYESSFRWRWVPEDRLPENIDTTSLEKRSSAISEFTFAVDKAETTGKYGKPAEYWQKFHDAIENNTVRRIKRTDSRGVERDAYEIGGYTYRIQNPDVADQVNAIMKRAKKRALGDAVKGAAAISEFFTVDVEDLVIVEETPDTQPPTRKPDLKVMDKPDVIDGEIIEDDPTPSTTTDDDTTKKVVNPIVQFIQSAAWEKKIKLLDDQIIAMFPLDTLDGDSLKKAGFSGAKEAAEYAMQYHSMNGNINAARALVTGNPALKVDAQEFNTRLLKVLTTLDETASIEAIASAITTGFKSTVAANELSSTPETTTPPIGEIIRLAGVKGKEDVAVHVVDNETGVKEVFTLVETELVGGLVDDDVMDEFTENNRKWQSGNDSKPQLVELTYEGDAMTGIKPKINIPF